MTEHELEYIDLTSLLLRIDRMERVVDKLCHLVNEEAKDRAKRLDEAITTDLGAREGRLSK